MTAPTTPEHGLTPGVLGVTASQEDIDRTVEAIRSYCGWHVWPQRTEALIVDGEGGVVSMLPTLRVTDIDKVTENSAEVSADSYEWSASGDLKRVDGCWTTRWRGIEVELTHGYAVCPFSALVASVAREIADAAKTGGGKLTKVGPFEFGDSGGGSASQAILSYRGTLDLYRLPALP